MQNYQDVLERLRQAKGEPTSKKVVLIPGVEISVTKASAIDVLRIGDERDSVKQVIYLLTLGEFDHKLTYQEAEELVGLIPGSDALRVMRELSEAMQMDAIVDIEAKKDFLEEATSPEPLSKSASVSENGRMKKNLVESPATP